MATRTEAQINSDIGRKELLLKNPKLTPALIKRVQDEITALKKELAISKKKKLVSNPKLTPESKKRVENEVAAIQNGSTNPSETGVPESELVFDEETMTTSNTKKYVIIGLVVVALAVSAFFIYKKIKSKKNK